MKMEKRHILNHQEAVGETGESTSDKRSKPKKENDRKPKLTSDEAKVANKIFNYQTIDEVRESVKNAPPQKMLIGELIYSCEQVILFGATNLGKSILATQFGIAIAEGIDLELGDETFENESEPQKVLYFDFELSDHQFTKRLGEITVGNNFRRATIQRGAILDGSPIQIFKIIKGAATTWGAKVIIIDNISKIGNRLEEADRATEFMGALWDLCRHDEYTIIIMAHTPKRDKKNPITADSISGSSKIPQLADSIIGINESPTEDQSTHVYIKQVKTRNGSRKYGEMNVVRTKIIEDKNGYVKHMGIGCLSEYAAINGENVKIKEKALATANILKHKTVRNAAEATGINHNTLWKRSKTFQERFPEDYERLKEKTPGELNEFIQLLQSDA